MRIFPEKYRILAWISVLLLAGFLTISITAYIVPHNAVQRNITEQALPLSSDNLYTEIQAELQRPTLIASMMASDSFVRDWLLGGEIDSEAMRRYLTEIKQQHGVIAPFLISERTRNAYNTEGIWKSVQESDTQDHWFFRLKENTAPFVSEIEIDPADRNAITVFIKHRLRGHDGTFLGVAGVGLRMDRLPAMIKDYEKHAGRRVYLVDDKRQLVLVGTPPQVGGGAVDALPGLRDIARDLLHGRTSPVLLQYRHGDASFFANSRYIPELGWHLLVTQNVKEEAQPVQRAFMLILAVGTSVTLLVLVLTLLMVNHYQKRLELIAGTDRLTDLLNRQAFEIVFRQAMLDADRSSRPLSGLLFDLDFFKQLNEAHGHLAGDEVLRIVARLAKNVLRGNDIIARWGGEEFIVLLKDCPLERAVIVSEKLRHEIDHYDFSGIVPDRHVTVSLGVAQHEKGETEMVFFHRLDEALSKAKANGRNRLHVACSGGIGNSSPVVESIQ